MKPKFGGILNIRFRAAGENPAISELHKKLEGVLEEKPVCIGEIRYGETSRIAYISLEIVQGQDDKAMALLQLLAWIRRYKSLLHAFRAEKWIEVSTYMLPEQAYEQLSFSVELMKAAIAADCRLDNTCYALMAPRDSMDKRIL
jgi:hypothetical protein